MAVADDLADNFQGAMTACRELLDATPPASETLRIAASQTLAVVLARVGRTAEAEVLLRDIVAYRGRQGDVVAETRSIIALADTLARGGNPASARAVLEERAAVIERSADELALAKRDDMLASMRQQEQGGRIPAPLLFADEDVRVSVTSEQGQVRCFHLLADVAQVEWRWDSAIDFTRHALNLAEDLDDLPGQTSSYAAMALQSMAVDQFDRAEWAARQCLRFARHTDNIRFATIARCSLVEIGWRTAPGRATRREVAVVRGVLRVAPDLPLALRAWLEHRFAAVPPRSTLGSWWHGLLTRIRPHAGANR